MDLNNLVVAISTAIGATIATLTTLYIRVASIRKQARTDALAEWKQITDHLQDRVKTLESDNKELQKSYVGIVKEAADLKGEIQLLESTVKRLQDRAGDRLPSTVLPASITCDLTGMVLLASPAVAPMFHWLPRELLGKNVDVLIPERYLEKYRQGLAKIISTQTQPWPEKTIVSYGKTRENEEIPISISLTAWKTKKDEWLISADIKQRVSAEVDDEKTTP